MRSPKTSKPIPMSWEKPLSVHEQTTQKCTLFLFVSHEEILSVWRHVELKRKREVRVDFLFHHSHHVERITHCVKTKDARKNLETGPTQLDNKWRQDQNNYERLELKALSTQLLQPLYFTISISKQNDTVEPPHNGHLGNRGKWRVLERWPLWGSRGESICFLTKMNCT